MRVAIHQPNFLPWRGFFAKAALADVFVLLDDVQFSKGSLTNRTRTPEGWVTVPVHASGKPLIRDVTIARGFSCHVGGYAVNARASERLVDLNAPPICEIGKMLAPDCMFLYASDLRSRATPGAAGLLELCREVGATSYLSGPSGVGYGVPEAFAGSGVEVVPFEFKPRDEIDRYSIACQLGRIAV